MASVLFSNNASGALASSITSTNTTITLTTGAGAQFPAISGGNFFYATLTDSSNNLEIVKVTARATDVFTVVRAQEGTTARAYAAADKLELRITAAVMSNLPQLGADQTFSGANTFSGATSLVSPTLTGTPIAPTASTGTNTTQIATTAFVQSALIAAYPIGSIYMSTVATNPGTLLGFGTWVAYGVGRMPISADGSTYVAGTTGGSATTTLSTTNLPSHTHTASLSGTAATGGTHVHTYKTYGLGSSGLVGNAYTNYDWGWVSTGNSPGTAEGAHSHSVTTSGTTDATGSGTAVTTISPYIAVYMWNRTA